MNKKITSAILALVLSYETSYAAANYLDGVLDHALMNVTPSGTIVEKDGAGNVKNRTFYTTSVYFRFGAGGAYPSPIINVSPPRISAGCNGLSLKGMFASIIGLDQLEEQLKNAGASLAWGIVVGLIYSLPGIGAAFRMIDTWAKKIQQLLANACQSGQMIAQNMFGDGLKDNSLKDFIATGDNYVVKGLQNVENATKVLYNTYLPALDDNMIVASTGQPATAPEQVAKNWQTLLLGSITGASFSTNALSQLLVALPGGDHAEFIKLAFSKSNLADIQPFDSAVFEMKLNGNSSNGEISLSEYAGKITGNLSARDDIARTFTQVAIIRAITGDIILKQNDITGTLNKVKDLVSINPVRDAAAKAAASTELKTLIDGTDNTPFNFDSEPNIKSSSELGTRLVNYLMNGAMDENNNTITNYDIDIKALKFRITAFPPNPEDTQNTGNLIFIFTAEPQSGVDELWFGSNPLDKGAVSRSAGIIRGMTTPGASANLPALETQYGIGLLVPDIINKIKIIQQTPETKREGLRKVLIDYNAYNTVLSAIDGFAAGGAFTTPLTPVFMFKNSILSKYKKGVSTRKEVSALFGAQSIAAQNNMDKFMKNAKETLAKKDMAKTTSELSIIFDYVNKENINAAIKVAPEK